MMIIKMALFCLFVIKTYIRIEGSNIIFYSLTFARSQHFLCYLANVGEIQNHV